MNKTESLPRVTCIMGPTASGKTHLAIELCQRFPFEIISVDSAMVYRGLNIGAAKPSKEELALAPHHLIDIRDPSDPYSAADFREDALRLINDILARGKYPLLVGGTMLYFKALQQGLSSLPTANTAIRKELLEKAADQGWQALHDELRRVDPASAERIHPNDPQRIQRALEVYYVSGQTMSSFLNQQRAPEFQFLNIGLIPSDRAWLHQRIEQRFHAMLGEGFLGEVRALFKQQGLHADLPAMRAVGYRQAWRYLQGDLPEDEWVAKAVVATRQLAKRQLTWLRRWPALESFDPEQMDLEQQVPALVARFLEDT